DTVHRRADLMRDICQKLALGSRRRLGRLLGLLERLSRLFLIVDIGEGAEPADDAARPTLAEATVVDREGPAERPGVRSLGGPAEAILGLVGHAATDRLGPVIAPLLAVVGVQGVLPAVAGQLLRRQAGVLRPAAVVVDDPAV